MCPENPRKERFLIPFGMTNLRISPQAVEAVPSQKTGVLTDESLVGAADFFQDGWICFGSGTGPRG
jgi:hypothetical protein